MKSVYGEAPLWGSSSFRGLSDTRIIVAWFGKRTSGAGSRS
jgi:hypothetical protein